MKYPLTFNLLYREAIQKGVLKEIDDNKFLTAQQKKNLKKGAEDALGFDPRFPEVTYASIVSNTKKEIYTLEGKARIPFQKI